jgi:two-component system LytT family response regulator
MKALIIEDEAPAAARVKKILSTVNPEVVVVEVCDSVESSVNWLKRNPPPDLILMDIELSDGKSFDIFSQVRVTSPVIFITAYDEFAIRAIKFNALDYLLKPINKEELSVALLKVMDLKINKSLPNPDYAFLQEMMKNISTGVKPKRLSIHNVNGTTYIDPEKIIRLEADSNYTRIFLSDGKKLIASRTLKEYDELLSGIGFFRVHSAHLINVSMVEKYIKGEGGFVEMNDGTMIEVSRHKKKELIALLS